MVKQSQITDFFGSPEKMQKGISFAHLEAKMKDSMEQSFKKRNAAPTASKPIVDVNPKPVISMDHFVAKMKNAMTKNVEPLQQPIGQQKNATSQTKSAQPQITVEKKPSEVMIEIPLSKKPKKQTVLIEEHIEPSPPLKIEAELDVSDDMFEQVESVHVKPAKEIFEIESKASKLFKKNLSVWLTNWEKRASNTPCVSFVWASSGSGRTHYIEKVASTMKFTTQFVNSDSTQLMNQVLIPLAHRSKKTLVIWKIEESLKTPNNILGNKIPLRQILKEGLFGTPKSFASGIKIMKTNELGQCYLEDAPAKWPNPLIIIVSDRYQGWVKEFHGVMVKDLSMNSFSGKSETDPRFPTIPPFIFKLTCPEPKEMFRFAEWHCKKRNIAVETSSINLLCRKSYGNIYSLFKLIGIIECKNPCFKSISPSKIAHDISSLNIHTSFEESNTNEYEEDSSSKNDFVPVEMDNGCNNTIASPNDLFLAIKKIDEQHPQDLFSCWESSSCFDSRNHDSSSFVQRLIKSELTCIYEKTTKQDAIFKNVVQHSDVLSEQCCLFSETMNWENSRDKLHYLGITTSHLLQDSYRFMLKDHRSNFILADTWKNQTMLGKYWSVKLEQQSTTCFINANLNLSLESKFVYTWIQSLFTLHHKQIHLSHGTQRRFVWADHLWQAFITYSTKTHLASFLGKTKSASNTDYMASKQDSFMLSNKVACFLYCLGFSSNDVLKLQEKYQSSCDKNSIDIVLLNNLKQCVQLLAMISNFALGKADPLFVLFEDMDFGHKTKGLAQMLKQDLKSLGIKQGKSDIVMQCLEDRMEQLQRFQGNQPTNIFEDEDEE